MKVDDGDWTSWLTATTPTEAVYSGELGHRYTFRVRATDHVSNTGAWSAEAGVMTVRVTKYYHFGNQRIAMRQGDVVYYLHGDHPSAGSGQAWAACGCWWAMPRGKYWTPTATRRLAACWPGSQ